MKANRIIQVAAEGKIIGTLAQANDHRIAFEYDAEWLESGFSISPFSLPLREEWIVKFPASFDKNEIGKMEFDYSLCAKKCGIEMKYFFQRPKCMFQLCQVDKRSNARGDHIQQLARFLFTSVIQDYLQMKMAGCPATFISNTLYSSYR